MVFPAYAGMSLVHITFKELTARFPRLRGDEPETAYYSTEDIAFSPLTRG